MTHQVNIETYAVVAGQRINVRTSVEHVPEGKASEQIILEKVIDLNEQVTRDALIALGWTPPDPATLDLIQEFYTECLKAASASRWIPAEYTANDWQADVYAFLRERPKDETRYEVIRDRIQAIQYEGEHDLVSWRFETPAPPFPANLPPTHERIATWLDTAVDMVAPKAVAPGVQVDPDECAAISGSCSMGPHGPRGERQCQYCGREDGK